MFGAARIRAIAAGTCASGTPNFDVAAPVAIAAWVCASIPGLTRSSTGVGRPANLSMRSMSSKPSTAMYPMRASRAAWMSASVLALPCMTIPAGSIPAASAMRSSPAPTTSQPRPSWARILMIDLDG